VAAREDWDEVVRTLRTAELPRSHPAFAQLHRLAVLDGKSALAGFRRLDDGLREDVIHDLIVVELEQLIAADRPRSYFMVAVRRRAIDLLRKLSRESPELDEEASARTASGLDNTQGDPAFVLDARQALASLSERDLRIVTAVGLGEDREALAASHGISRAAVDQIVSRVRKRWAEGER
jgi:DNA-directed RNA polymerase specialized sigma24 family protein